MNHHLEIQSVFNQRDRISGSYQPEGAASLSTVNLIGLRIKINSDPTGLGQWKYQVLWVQVSVKLCITT